MDCSLDGKWKRCHWSCWCLNLVKPAIAALNYYYYKFFIILSLTFNVSCHLWTRPEEPKGDVTNGSFHYNLTGGRSFDQSLIFLSYAIGWNRVTLRKESHIIREWLWLSTTVLSKLSVWKKMSKIIVIWPFKAGGIVTANSGCHFTFCRLRLLTFHFVVMSLVRHLEKNYLSPKEIQDLLIQSFSHIVCEIPSGFDVSFFSIKMIFDSFFVDDVADNEWPAHENSGKNSQLSFLN